VELDGGWRGVSKKNGGKGKGARGVQVNRTGIAYCLGKPVRRGASFAKKRGGHGVGKLISTGNGGSTMQGATGPRVEAKIVFRQPDLRWRGEPKGQGVRIKPFQGRQGKKESQIACTNQNLLGKSSQMRVHSRRKQGEQTHGQNRALGRPLGCCLKVGGRKPRKFTRVEQKKKKVASQVTRKKEGQPSKVEAGRGKTARGKNSGKKLLSLRFNSRNTHTKTNKGRGGRTLLV